MNTINHTHDVKAISWLPSANDSGCNFPIQNLPFAIFTEANRVDHWRAGVAIGDMVLDLDALCDKRLLTGFAAEAIQNIRNKDQKVPSLNSFMALGQEYWTAFRQAIFGLLLHSVGLDIKNVVQSCLIPQSNTLYRMPVNVANYTDFYTSIHHARNVGRLARPDNPLTANFQWIPIAYHGRASSVVISGTPFHRPMGQSMAVGGIAPVYGPCLRMDFELELGLFIGKGNALGNPIHLSKAENHMFGVCLLNDWSARDIQFWEMDPLGPFLGKNFCTTISPWIVTMEALAPYRVPFTRPDNEPQPLAYLEDEGNRKHGSIDIQLEVLIESARNRELGQVASTITKTSFKHQYWTFAQMVTQHTVGGCNLQTGDLLGSGTISGPTQEEAGAIIELTKGGKEPITLSDGEKRSFLQDGDAVILRGWCHREGFARIGFGENRGEVLPIVG